MSENLDLLDDSIPIGKRIHGFIQRIEELGYDPHAIENGTLDCHVLSQAMNVSPQIILTYFELCVLEEKERDYLERKKLDMGIIRTLMLIEPQLREIIYENLDDYLKDDHPVSRIIEHINSGEWRMTIQDLYKYVDRKYWGAVGSYLKDIDFTDGTINRSFRSMLVQITRKASIKQLDWLERGILHDHLNGFSVFTADTFREKYATEVEFIEKFLGDHDRFESL